MANRFLDWLTGPGSAPPENGAIAVSTNGNGKHAAPPPIEQKAALPPLTVITPAVRDFWLPGNPELETTRGDVTGLSAYRLAALAYICIRYRATKVREAPLMVVEETEEGEEWIEDHELAPLLAKPNPDYGMARLIEATETYLCLTGRCLWVKSRDRGQRVARLYPFSGDDFTIESADGRLYGRFRVNGREPIAPDDVCYFSYFAPGDPLGGVAPLDAALAHLNIGQALAERVKSHVRKAMMPGGVYVADKEARFTDEDFTRLKAELQDGFTAANSGRPIVLEGGGKLEKGFTLSELQLGELWREVEATVCGCFGVPASLVGTVVGLENSPWSHLETAKRSFYDETILPEWELLEEVLTESLLRGVDDDLSHLVRFDTSRIRALQKDVAAAAVVASTAQRWTSVNERRVMMGLPKSDDPKADEIPELTAPPAPKPIADQTNPADGTDVSKRRRVRVTQKARDDFGFLVADAVHEQHVGRLEITAAAQLHTDQEAIASIVERELGQRKESQPTDRPLTERERQRLLTAIQLYLDQRSAEAWARLVTPLLSDTAEASLFATVVPDLDVSVQLLRPHIASFVRREVGFLIQNIQPTTLEAVQSALTEAIEAGDGIQGIAKRIRDSAGFDRPRAALIARTETTRTLTGAPVEALQQYGATTGQGFTKTWRAVGGPEGDGRNRDEHLAMHGETVAMDAAFSNGLKHPSEPNCRCSLTYGVEGVAA